MNTPYNAKRKVRETTIFPYEPVMHRLIAMRNGAPGYDGIPLTLSDKLAAAMCSTSERQIRKARLHGMDPYLADHICVKGLGLTPMDVYGDDWLTAEAYFADDIARGKLDPSELPALAETIEQALLADLGEAAA